MILNFLSLKDFDLPFYKLIMSYDSVSFQDYQFQSHVIPTYIYNHFPVRESLYDEQAFIIKLANSKYSKVKEDKAIFMVSFDGFDFFDPVQNIERIDDYMKRFSHVKKVYLGVFFWERFFLFGESMFLETLFFDT